MRKYLLAMALLVSAGTPGLADDANPTPPEAVSLCYLGGIAFSAGTNIRAGDGVSVCLADGRWRPTSGPAAGCLKDGRLFALGSASAIGDAKNGKQTCHKNGSWA
jgi:hypothetical protein